MSFSPAATAARQRQSAWTTVDVDLGDTPVFEGSFTITDEGIQSDSKVLVQQAAGPYAGKGTLADEFLMDQLQCSADPGDGSATVYFRVISGGRVRGHFSFHYTVV